MSGFKVFLFSGRLGTTLLLYIQAIAVRRTELSNDSTIWTCWGQSTSVSICTCIYYLLFLTLWNICLNIAALLVQ